MMSQKLASSYGAGLLGTFLFSTQNGGEDRKMNLRSLREGSPAATERASSLELPTPYKSGGERKPRAADRGRAAPGNNSQDVDDDEEEEGDGGSLPCAAELRAHTDTDGPAEVDRVFESLTRRVIGTFLTDFVRPPKAKRKQDQVQVTMRRVVDGVLEKHRYAYKGMIQKLELDGRGEEMSFVTSVAKSLFADSTTNWGRIASLLAFGAALCQYLQASGKEGCVSLVAEEISSYLLSDQREWLVKNNSWDGFVEFFRVSDPEAAVRNTLMALAGFAGIGATIALFIR